MVDEQIKGKHLIKIILWESVNLEINFDAIHLFREINNYKIVYYYYYLTELLQQQSYKMKREKVLLEK